MARLRAWHPHLDSTRRLQEQLSLPQALTGYLIWLTAELRRQDTRFCEALRRFETVDGGSPPVVDFNDARDQWWMLVERLQVLAELVIAEAVRRGLRDVATSFAGLRWLAPLPGPVNARMMTDANDHAMRGAPPWPTDPAYGGYGPDRRDQLSQAQFARAIGGASLPATRQGD